MCEAAGEAVRLNRSILSSDKQDWETPWTLFNPLDNAFHFDIDVCANDTNTKCPHFIYNGSLETGWKEKFEEREGDYAPVCWCNPPYNQAEKWLKKAYEEALKGCTVVCLVAARPDTKAWQNVIFPHAQAICFIRGRIKFVGAKDPAMFPSALVVFKDGPLWQEQTDALEKFGHVVR
jgi:site-specific DNA-methyltransferase (adenine-specific)